MESVTHETFVPGPKNGHGNATGSWGDGVAVEIYAFDPGATSEPREGMSRVIVEPTLYMPTSVTFAAQDRVTVRGKRYLVEGETREWRHPNGKRPGNVVTLRRVDG